LNYEKTKFRSLLDNFGKRKIVGSNDIKFSFILATVLVLIATHLNILDITINLICPQFITVSSALIAIIIAGLAIVVSISDDNFILMLKTAKVYDKILFLFYYATMLSGFSIVANIIAYATSKNMGHIIFNIQFGTIIFMILLWLSTFLALYSLFSVILLVGTIMRYGLYRGAFIEMNNKK
jgi:hypothetical protein